MNEPTITKDEAERRWIRGAGFTREAFDSYRMHAVRCECGEPFCQGWRIEMFGPLVGVR